jgi:transcriptional regulator with XRE-family HTH domain
MAERLVRQRTSLGLSQKESAIRIGVDPGTLARRERRETRPTGVLLGWVEQFFRENAAQSGARRVG